MMAAQSEQRGENCKLHIRRRSETALLLQWLLHYTARDGVQGTVDILQWVQHELLASAVCAVNICSVCCYYLQCVLLVSAVCVIYLQCIFSVFVSSVCWYLQCVLVSAVCVGICSV